MAPEYKILKSEISACLVGTRYSILLFFKQRVFIAAICRPMYVFPLPAYTQSLNSQTSYHPVDHQEVFLEVS
jgi:hypothetical protein